MSERNTRFNITLKMTKEQMFPILPTNNLDYYGIPKECPTCGSKGSFIKMGRHTDTWLCDKGGHQFVFSKQSVTGEKE